MSIIYDFKAIKDAMPKEPEQERYGHMQEIPEGIGETAAEVVDRLFGTTPKPRYPVCAITGVHDYDLDDKCRLCGIARYTAYIDPSVAYITPIVERELELWGIDYSRGYI